MHYLILWWIIDNLPHFLLHSSLHSLLFQCIIRDERFGKESVAMKRYQRFVRCIFALLVLFSFLCVSLLTNSDGSVEDSFATRSMQQSICDSRIAFDEIACHEDGITTELQKTFTYHTLRGSVSLKYLRMILVVCLPAGIFLPVHTGIFWVSEKATTRSQKSIIQFIHNKDGKKE